MEKSDKCYWENNWAMENIPKAINPHKRGLRNYNRRRFHEFFYKIFSGMKTDGSKLLEIGCARSRWLPYFSKEFGFDISGIDYSETGCRQAQKILDNEDVNGKILCADFFSPPESMLENFDIVVSFGVVEHFEETAKCISEFSKFLKPGGILITQIPNMTGLIGLVQKMVNKPVFDIHVPLDKNALKDAHEFSGLEMVESDYFLFTNFGVCNLNKVSISLSWLLKKVFILSLISFSALIWLIEDLFGPFKPNKVMSPYINCFAKKPKASLKQGE